MRINDKRPRDEKDQKESNKRQSLSGPSPSPMNDEESTVAGAKKKLENLLRATINTAEVIDIIGDLSGKAKQEMALYCLEQITVKLENSDSKITELQAVGNYCFNAVTEETLETKDTAYNFFSFKIILDNAEIEKLLKYAVLAGDVDKLKQLNGSKIDIRENEYVDKTLLCAAKNGQANIVRCLVEEYQVEVDKTLIWAAQNNHLNLVRYLVEKGGANVVVKNQLRYIALVHAAQNNHLNMVKDLVEEYVGNVEAKNRLIYEALKHAAQKGHLDIIRYFVEKEANVEEKDILIYKALEHATGHLKIVIYLIKECGTNVDSKKDFVFMAQMWAHPNDRLNIIRHFKNELYQSGFLNQILLFSARNGHSEIVKCLVEECKANVEAKDGNGNTALDFALEYRKVDTAKYLRDKGASLNENSMKRIEFILRDELSANLQTSRKTKIDSLNIPNYVRDAKENLAADSEEFKTLLANVKTLAEDNENDYTAIYYAIVINNVGLLKCLLEEKYDDRGNSFFKALKKQAEDFASLKVRKYLEEEEIKATEKNTNNIIQRDLKSVLMMHKDIVDAVCPKSEKITLLDML